MAFELLQEPRHTIIVKALTAKAEELRSENKSMWNLIWHQ